MNMLNQFLWVIFPYTCLVIFIIGHIYRYRYDQFHWTTKSSELIEKRHLKWGSILFHLGVIPVFFGHVSGLVIPKTWYEAIGVNNEMYHFGAYYIGSIFGFMTLIGMILLTARRLSIRNVRKLSSASDMIVNLMLLLIVILGMLSTIVTKSVNPEFDYRETISIWFRNLFFLHPNAAYMTDVPILFKLHIIAGLLIFALWPFTRLVHVWSVPLQYLGRNYVVYRRNKRSYR